MIVEKIPQIGNKLLRERSLEVTNEELSSTEIKAVISDLTDTMLAKNLIGMAAPQLGLNKRIFITDIREVEDRKEDKDELRVFINPEIIFYSKETNISYEGCGSVMQGNLFGPVKRSNEIKVIALDEIGEKFEISATGLLARAIQHEVDHLEGILFTDRVEDNTKLMSREEYKKMQKNTHKGDL